MRKGIKAPEIWAESCQDIFVSFEADTFDHQHAVTQEPLNPLLLQLLQQVGAVAGEGIHGHSASDHLGANSYISKLAEDAQIRNINKIFQLWGI